MNIKTVWHATLHEMRNVRRLIRTHVFIWTAVTISSLYFSIVTLSHMLDASQIAMLGVISPRYIFSLLSGSFLALFCVGVLLLTFDQFKRDETSRIHEVISSRPVTNIELYLGRLFGVSMTMAIPMVMFLVSIVTYGIVSERFSFQFGEPVEIWSVVSFMFLDIAPNFLFFGSLVILFFSMFKSRLLALLFALCFLFATFWINSRLPLDVASPLHTVSGNVLYPSDLIPTFLTLEIAFNRIALVCVSIGFLFWASGLCERVTPSRSTNLAFGSLSVCCGIVVIGALFATQFLEYYRIGQWIKVHDEHFYPSTFPDVRKIRGSIDVNPGRSLSLDLTLDVSVDTYEDTDYVLFSFNPGFHIAHLTVAGKTVSDYEFQHGLLKIPKQQFRSDTTKLEIKATGRPDNRFAYLDSRDALSQIVGPDVRQLRQFGTESSIFRSEFVALLPGIKWYPTSGTSTKEDHWEYRDKDFFTVDIEVSVPRDWLIAGPAKRETLTDGKRTTFRFQQSTPLPELALVGSKFEAAAIEVEGIRFELLYSSIHQHTFHALKQIENNIQDRVKSIIDDVRARGFDYPYGSFALVEVPSTLRVFGGGLSMDTVMCPPGIVMLRESTLPTISVHSLIDGNRKKNFKQYNWDDQVWIDWEFQAISQYLQHPMFESNVNLGFFRSLFVEQTSATQEGAHALNLLLKHLIGALFPYAEADFDFQLAHDRYILNVASVDPLQFIRFHRRKGFHTVYAEMQRKKRSILSASNVWESVRTVNLYDPVHEENSVRSMRATRLRTERLVQLLIDTVGTEKLAQISEDLTNRFRGQSFRLTEFKALLDEHGVRLDELSGDLISAAELPGFSASNQTIRQRDVEDLSKYETTFLLENGEPISGPVKLTLALPFMFGATQTFGFQPILVEANQTLLITIESSNPAKHIGVKPYLSLNRMDFRLDLPLSAEMQGREYVQGEAPFIKSIEASDQKLDPNSSITVDDLDLGFSIMDRRVISPFFKTFNQFARKLVGESAVPLDQGLPNYQISYRPKTKIWSRWTDPTAFGIYRRTFAMSEAGDGLAVAKFSATLPSVGEWKLEYHLPKGYFFEAVDFSPTAVVGAYSMTSPHTVGTFHLNIENGSATYAKTLDAPNLNPGWQVIGNFDLTDLDVSVLVSNETDESPMYVIADAIRWVPVETKK